jgi:hypothetical protein
LQALHQWLSARAETQKPNAHLKSIQLGVTMTFLLL